MFAGQDHRRTLPADATRGGVATILNEVARVANVAVVIDERAIPVRAEGACERRFVAIVDGNGAQTALQAMRSQALGMGAAIIGAVKDDPSGLVLLKTQFGGTRIVDVLIRFRGSTSS